MRQPHLVDAAHKQQAGPPAYTAQHQEEGKAHHSIVAKEEAGLQQTMHLTPAEACDTQQQQQKGAGSNREVAD